MFWWCSFAQLISLDLQLICIVQLLCSLLDLLAALIGPDLLHCPVASTTTTTTTITTTTTTTVGGALTSTSTTSTSTPTVTPSFSGYNTVFSGANAAIISDCYITFGLTDSDQGKNCFLIHPLDFISADCVAMCGAMSGCKCANGVSSYSHNLPHH